MYEVKVEQGSNFGFVCHLSYMYIASILFIQVNFTLTGTQKLRDNGNPPLLVISIVGDYNNVTMC